MARKDNGSSLGRATKAFQANVTSAGPAAAASYSLIGAIVLLGGIGYAVDRWQGTAPWGLVIGLALGLVVGFYELVKTAWVSPAGRDPR